MRLPRDFYPHLARELVMTQKTTPSRKHRIIKTLLVLFICLACLYYWKYMRKVDLDVSFHFSPVAHTPQNMELSVIDSHGTAAISMQKSIDYPIAPKTKWALRPGNYELRGFYTDTRGNKHEISKNIVVPEDSAEMEIHF